MSARRPRAAAVTAIVAALLAVVLWWLSQGSVTVGSPTGEGVAERTVVDPRWLAGAALSTAVAMIAATRWVLGRES